MFLHSSNFLSLLGITSIVDFEIQSEDLVFTAGVCILLWFKKACLCFSAPYNSSALLILAMLFITLVFSIFCICNSFF